MQTNWRDFGIGMASGVAFCFVLYFGWGLIHPHRPDTANAALVANAPAGMDENALVAANAERPNNTTMLTPPPQLRPEPRDEVRNEPVVIPEPRPEPSVVRPRPERDPDEDLPPPDDPGLDDDGGKPPPE